MLLLLTIVSASAFGIKNETPLETMHCQEYTCDTHNIVPDGSCIVLQNSTYHLSTCKNTTLSHCDIVTGRCTAPTVEPVVRAWPGEFCNNSTVNCTFGTCLNQICVGKVDNEDCTSHNFCNPGLMCNSTFKCTPLLAAGQFGCRDNYDCVASAVCDVVSKNNGTCIEYASLPTGSSVADCINGKSTLCRSTLCVKNNTLTSKGTCINAPTSLSKHPAECSADSDCQATDGLTPLKGQCICGMNPLGKAFCKQQIGDPKGQASLEAYKAHLALADMCNTMRRDEEVCLKMTKQSDRVFFTEYEYYFYSLLQGNDVCTKQIFNKRYWDLSGERLIAPIVLSCPSM